jgi:hypothetical protein
MELGKPFTYIFQDKRWFSKVLVGWLVSIVPILNFAFTGYYTQTIRNVEGKLDEPLPEWDDFGKKFVLGFYLFLAGIVYSLPILLLSGIFIVPVAIAANGEASDTLNALMAGTGVVVSCVIVLYGLALTIFLPAMNINLARKETLGSVFEIGEFFKIFRANTGDYLVAWIMTIVWAIAISIVGAIIAFFIVAFPIIGWCLGWIIAPIFLGMVNVVIFLVYAHLFGQVAAKAEVPAVIQ